jgi:hypothetical protein
MNTGLPNYLSIKAELRPLHIRARLNVARFFLSRQHAKSADVRLARRALPENFAAWVIIGKIGIVTVKKW